MKKPDSKVLVSIVSLVALTLACNAISGVPGGGGGNGGPTPILSDDFSDSSSGWGIGTDANSSVEYANGGLQFAVFTNFYITWSNPNLENYQNVHVEVTVRNTSADPLAIFGIICHEQESQDFYYLGVAADGYFTISKSVSGQDDVSYADGTSPSVPSGSDPFTIGADCGNGNLALYINSQQIASAQDSTFTSGKVGLFAWTDEQASGANVTFDDFVMTPMQ